MSENAIIKNESTPMSLIQAALDKGVDVERLDGLLTLQERWERNGAIRAFSEAMNECQRVMPTVVKDRENQHTRSRYATLEAVNHAIKPVYTERGFSISFNEDEMPSAESIKLTATVRHSGGHSEQFSTVVPIDGAGLKGGANKTGTQAKGSTLTYARRYLTLMIFNVAVADEDLDGCSENSPISEEQALFLQGLIDQCEAAGDPLNAKRFFQMFKLPEDATIDQLKCGQYEAAKAGLRQKLERAGKETAK